MQAGCHALGVAFVKTDVLKGAPELVVLVSQQREQAGDLLPPREVLWDNELLHERPVQAFAAALKRYDLIQREQALVADLRPVIRELFGEHHRGRGEVTVRPARRCTQELHLRQEAHVGEQAHVAKRLVLATPTIGGDRLHVGLRCVEFTGDHPLQNQGQPPKGVEVLAFEVGERTELLSERLDADDDRGDEPRRLPRADVDVEDLTVGQRDRRRHIARVGSRFFLRG